MNQTNQHHSAASADGRVQPTPPATKARLFEFGCAPEAKRLGYSVLSQIVCGTKQSVLDRFETADVILVTGAAVFRTDDQFEFAVFAKPAPSNAAPRHPMRAITLDREEGERAHWKATTFAGANRVLADWALTAPAQGGYDKVRVHITWANGLEYSYRLDLKHPSCDEDAPDVERDLRFAVDFALGLLHNPDWSDAQHQRVLARYEQQGVVALARRLRAECVLGDFEFEDARSQGPAAAGAALDLISELAGGQMDTTKLDQLLVGDGYQGGARDALQSMALALRAEGVDVATINRATQTVLDALDNNDGGAPCASPR